MRWFNRIVMISLALGGLILAGCGSRSQGSIDVNPTVNPISDERLQPAADPVLASLEGRITLSGLTLATEPDGPAGGASATASQIVEPRILVRVIDPGEDILVATVNPDLSGRFSIAAVKPLAFAKLEVEFKVVEDINGDATANDVIQQAVPLAFEAGKVAQVELTLATSLARPLPGVPVDGPLMADVDLLPASGMLLLVNLAVQDGNGYHEDFYGVNYSDNTVVYDTDGDNYLERGEDYQGQDADVNGWADSFEQTFTAPAEPAVLIFDGYITSVDLGNSTARLLKADGTLVVLQIDPFVAIEELNSSPAAGGNAQFLGPLPFDPALIGQYVQVEAMAAAGGFRVLWFVVIDPPAPKK